MKRTLITCILLAYILTSCYSEEKNIHPSFNLNIKTLEEIIYDLNQEIQRKILDNPVRFLELSDFMLSQPEELFFLADKEHAITKEQAPEETVKPSDYGISYTVKDREVSSLIINQLKKMYDAAAKEGIELIFASGYRPFDYQEIIYNRYVKELGQEEADRISAKPGTSQHQLGTAVDFGSISDEYANTPEGIWLFENAGQFGFSLSYPDGLEDLTGYKWENWHYRYITPEGIKMQNEFFLQTQQYLMKFWDNHKEQLKNVWRK
ncbi:MAG: M15 family metallopeptidase [Spirochaetaceae bacterium]|nr:M15 family metallopeptidase [Spirochaetaceae bacterium]